MPPFLSAMQGPLVVVKPVPFNAESPIAALREPVTPTESFYVRSHFAVPDIQPDGWRLDIGGLVARPLSLLLDDLLAIPSRTVTATMECAGNGRIGFAPLPKGEPWGGGRREHRCMARRVAAGAPRASRLRPRRHRSPFRWCQLRVWSKAGICPCRFPDPCRWPGRLTPIPSWRIASTGSHSPPSTVGPYGLSYPIGTAWHRSNGSSRSPFCSISSPAFIRRTGT